MEEVRKIVRRIKVLREYEAVRKLKLQYLSVNEYATAYYYKQRCDEIKEDLKNWSKYIKPI